MAFTARCPNVAEAAKTPAVCLISDSRSPDPGVAAGPFFASGSTGYRALLIKTDLKSSGRNFRITRALRRRPAV